MSAQNVKSGDIVLVDKLGRRFYAEVTGTDGVGRERFSIRPIDRNVTYRTCGSRDIKCRYKRCKS